MIIIGGSSNPTLAQQIASKIGCGYIMANTKKFADQELKVKINKALYAQEIVIVQSTAQPVNDNLMELLLIADAAKKAGCISVTAIIPYFGYGRQDKASGKDSAIATNLVARLIEESGIDKIITLDMHSERLKDFFKIEIVNVDLSDLFVNVLSKQVNSIVVSPDIGGLLRANTLATKLGTDVIIMNKKRNAEGKCFISDISADVVGKNCIILDDIADTGNTLYAAAELLNRMGVHSINACITHAVFSPGCIEVLGKVKFKTFLITDTIRQQNLPSFIKTISVSDIIAKSLMFTQKKYVTT
jgi:ribose-phosphate pyrophosphokinase